MNRSLSEWNKILRDHPATPPGRTAEPAADTIGGGGGHDECAECEAPEWMVQYCRWPSCPHKVAA